MSETPRGGETVAVQPSTTLLTGLGRLESVGDEDAGRCVDGVCVIPARDGA